MKNPKIKKQYLGVVTIPILKDGFENRIDLNDKTSAEDLKLVAADAVGVTFLEEDSQTKEAAPTKS